MATLFGSHALDLGSNPTEPFETLINYFWESDLQGILRVPDALKRVSTHF